LLKKENKYRTVLEVQAPSKLALRIGLISLDLIYLIVSAEGLYIYQLRKEDIQVNHPNATLLTVVLPLLSGLGLLMIIRMIISIFLFLVVPNRSKSMHRKLFMKLGGGLYADAKFPMLTYKEYIL
jgi:hypothetical protein